MKYLIAFTMVSMLIATNTAADQLEYDLEVNGMVCAYCAYNVSKQLQTLDGVIPESVDVDLDKGRVKLRSKKKLDGNRLADLFLQAGFELGAVTEAVASSPLPRRQWDKAVFLRVTMNSDRIGDGEFDRVLEALGAIAAERSARIMVVGPAELETAILKPVLAGRKTVIIVDYDPVIQPNQAVVVSISVSEKSTR